MLVAHDQDQGSCSDFTGRIFLHACNAGKRQEYLLDIRESGLYLLNLLNLLNNILDVCKIEMGRLEIAATDIDVAQTLHMCHRLVQERAQTAGVELSLEIPGDLPGLHADPTRLKQSLLNLLSNAIKFSRPGDSIVTGAMVDEAGSLRISVTDTGPGISPDEIETVREPFSRGRSSQIAAKEGSGIGLALTASLMENHEGRLDLDSTLGVGTRATLVFPAHRVVARRPPCAAIA
jgi:signal transduction histidine kinase